MCVRAAKAKEERKKKRASSETYYGAKLKSENQFFNRESKTQQKAVRKKRQRSLWNNRKIEINIRPRASTGAKASC
jgi:hypothetical protein